VADVPGVTGGAVPQPPVEYETAADASADDHAEDVAKPGRGAAPGLARDDAERVVVHPDGNAGHPVAQPLA
jgi:hypothetical protein